MEQDELETRVRNLRADFTMFRTLIDALIIAMPPQPRAALVHNFGVLSEQNIARALAHSPALQDETVRALQRSADMLKASLEALPASPANRAR